MGYRATVNTYSVFRFLNFRSGDTVLHYTVRHGNLHVLKWLTEIQGADLEQANLDAKRPLHEAAQSSYLNCVEYLIGKGVTTDSLKRADWYASLSADFIGLKHLQ